MRAGRSIGCSAFERANRALRQHRCRLGLPIVADRPDAPGLGACLPTAPRMRAEMTIADELRR